MDMKKMLQQAQQMQSQLEKTMKEFDEKLFTFDYKGLVSVEIFGSLRVKTINVIDANIIDKDDKETLEDIITQCINNAVTAVLKGKTEITTRIAGPAMQGLM